jgi:hypothetical protein
MSDSTATKTVAIPATAIVTDSIGRSLEVRKLDALEQLDFFECAGSAASTTSWMAMAMVAVAVRTIDGVPCPFPASKEGIRKAVAKLGMEGINCATTAFITPDDAADDVEQVAKN